MIRIDRQHEASRMISLLGDDANVVHGVLSHHFSVLTARAQVLLGLCGVVITTTGFSGRMIAGTNALAQWLIVSGISLTMVSAAIVVFGVLPLRWLTQVPGDDVRSWIIQALRYRDRKLASYRVAVFVLLAGLVLYVWAIAIMLLHPDADAVRLIR